METKLMIKLEIKPKIEHSRMGTKRCGATQSTEYFAGAVLLVGRIHG